MTNLESKARRRRWPFRVVMPPHGTGITVLKGVAQPGGFMTANTVQPKFDLPIRSTAAPGVFTTGPGAPAEYTHR